MSHTDGAVPAAPPLGAKKLRFDNAVTVATPSASDISVGGTTSGRSALKSSPTISSPPLFTSSLRRPSEGASSHSDVHVQLNPNPEVIQHDGRVTTLAADAMASVHPVAAAEEPAGEVANFLADVGAGLNNGVSTNSISVPSVTAMSGSSIAGSSAAVGNNGSTTSDNSMAVRSATPDASERFRSLLLQLSALILEHRPKDPEQYIVDHLQAHLLSASAIGRAPLNECNAEKHSDDDQEDVPVAGEHPGGDAESSIQHPVTAAGGPVAFQPFGDTVVERLASNALSTEVGHAVLLRVAELLISTQPDDPEDFLWARLEARNFGEEAAHNVTMNAEGFSVVRPEDPTQLALLKDIPASSPGYVVAVNLFPILFAKKPADPISYLFYHIGNRARSSTAQSVHSSTRHLRVNVDEEDDFDADSCTSRELGEDSYSGAEDAADNGSVSESANQFPLQRKGSLGSLFDSTAATAATNSASAAAQSVRRSTGDRSLSGRRRQAHGLTNSRTSSVLRGAAGTAGSSRAMKDSSPSSVPVELSALYSSTAKRVSIAQQEVQPPSPSHFSYDSSALPGVPGAAGSTRSNRNSASTAEPHATAGPQPTPFAAAARATASALWRMEAEEHARIRQEFDLLRLREELRLERLQHEVRTLTRECEYRTRMAVLNKSDRMADRAAAASREALEEAHLYRGFLCAQIDQLESEQQRQLRMVSQQVARITSPTSATVPMLPSPVLTTWLGEDAVFRQAEQRDACGSATPYGVPSELDILKKQVELLTMEQARAKFCPYNPAPFNAYTPASQSRFRTVAAPGAQTSS